MSTYYERNRERVLKYQKEYQKKRWESDPFHMRSIKVKAVYGITKEEFVALTEKYQGKCGICSMEAKLHIDHDHKTNKVRGLLCGKCNKAIGLFDEDMDKMNKAVKYLKATK